MTAWSQAITENIAELEALYSPGVRGFLNSVYGADLEVYHQRLLQYGFTGLGRVLDAGCGFGQWSLWLAQMNREVEGIDASTERLLFLRRLIQRLGLANLRLSWCDLPRIDFPDGHFDGIFSFNVVSLTAWKETLAEMARVLKPGGLLYVNANGLGWYKHMWYDLDKVSSDGVPVGARMPRVLQNTVNYRRGLPLERGMDILIEPEEMRAELEKLGLGEITIVADGLANFVPGPGREPRSFYKGEYRGDTGVYDVLCRKGA